MKDLFFSFKSIEVLIYLMTVLALFVFLVNLIKIFRQKFNFSPFSSPQKLMIQETLILDTKRRLVRFQNHQTEHLILLGPHTDLLLQSNNKENERDTSDPFPPPSLSGNSLL